MFFFGVNGGEQKRPKNRAKVEKHGEGREEIEMREREGREGAGKSGEGRGRVE